MRVKCILFILAVIVSAIPGIAAEKAPSPATLHFRNGVELMRMGRWQKAIVSLEKAAELAPERADIQEALGGTYFNYAVELSLNGPETPGKDIKAAQAEMVKRVEKMMSVAEAALKKSVELEPKNAGYHHTLGWFYLASYRQHLFDAAPVTPKEKEEKTGSKESTEARPEPAPTPPAKPDYAKLAIQEFESAAKLAPRVDDYYRSLADALQVIGTAEGKLEKETEKKIWPEEGIKELPEPPKPTSKDRVLEECRKAVAVNPNNALLHYTLYNYLMERSENPTDEALDHLQRACALDTSNALYGYELARYYFIAGRNPDALNALRMANLAPRLVLSYYPSYPKRLAAGLSLLQIGRKDMSVHSRLEDMARAASVIARSLANTDVRMALAAQQEVVRMGERLAFEGDTSTRLLGVDIATMELRDVLALASWMGDYPTWERARIRLMELTAMGESLFLQSAEEPAPVPAEGTPETR